MIEFRLDPKSGVPFYRQIIDQIKYGIATGSLSTGEQLPTVRSLAVELKVNLNTVTKAYKELEIQNILESHQGTGTFIGNIIVNIPDKERHGKLKSICREFLGIAVSYGFTADDVIKELSRTREV
ncbi:MAG: GntR family transcriptional regulator [Candidatus Krumholzibacteriota bacterium]|nr:GntR family transcriptional regulator [Candidatus Krumholzibacteriota bacterium]